MKKLLIVLLVVVLSLLTVSSALAHAAPPCNDSDGDGSPSGREYAEHHISELAKQGVIGQGHKPGSHRGFSACSPSEL